MQLMVKIALFLAIAYGVIAVAAFIAQRKLMYFPDRERLSPESYGLVGVEERVISSPEGAQLVTWFARAQPGQPTILYFHGNAGNLGNRSERIRKYVARGLGMMMLSYRGYGGSTGTPSERNNFADARLAYEALRKEGVKPEDIILYGESLGTGVAVQLAAQVPVAGVVLDAPYTSIVEVAADAYPYLPVRWFLFDRYETMSYLKDVHVPILVIHGEDDRIIPVKMGRAVYAAANGPKEIVTFPGAGHSNHHLYGSNEEVFRWIDAAAHRAADTRSEKQMRP